MRDCTKISDVGIFIKNDTILCMEKYIFIINIKCSPELKFIDYSLHIYLCAIFQNNIFVHKIIPYFDVIPYYNLM